MKVLLGLPVYCAQCGCHFEYVLDEPQNMRCHNKECKNYGIKIKRPTLNLLRASKDSGKKVKGNSFHATC